jgi:arylsulfatase
MTGHRAIYAEGWKAVTRHDPGTSFDDDTWELYNVEVDRSECNDLAAAEPERLAAMIELWWAEAEEHNVLPLDDRGIELFGARFVDRTPHPTSRKYVYYPPMSAIPPQAGIAIGGRSWDLDAYMTRAAGQQGVILATGTENSGLSIFVKDDHAYLDNNAFNDHAVLKSTVAVPVGESKVTLQFRRTGRGGTATFFIDDQEAGSCEIPFVMRVISSVGTSLGTNHGSSISPLYEAPFTFDGVLDRVEVQLVTPRRDQESEVAESEARSIMGRQ